MATAASSSAEQALVQERIATLVTRAEPPAESTGKFVATGTVRLPVALPPEVLGRRADGRRGVLAIASVQVVDPNGMVVLQGEGSVTWRDATWLIGGPKFRRIRPLDDVLRDAVRDAVDRAVRALRRP